jgi:hypothetical protein
MDTGVGTYGYRAGRVVLLLLLLMISKNGKRKPRDGRYMLERGNERRRQMNSITMLYNTDLSLSELAQLKRSPFLLLYGAVLSKEL